MLTRWSHGFCGSRLFISVAIKLMQNLLWLATARSYAVLPWEGGRRGGGRRSKKRRRRKRGGKGGGGGGRGEGKEEEEGGGARGEEEEEVFGPSFHHSFFPLLTSLFIPPRGALASHNCFRA